MFEEDEAIPAAASEPVAASAPGPGPGVGGMYLLDPVTGERVLVESTAQV